MQWWYVLSCPRSLMLAVPRRHPARLSSLFAYRSNHQLYQFTATRCGGQRRGDLRHEQVLLQAVPAPASRQQAKPELHYL